MLQFWEWCCYANMVWHINQFWLISFHVMAAKCNENKNVVPSVYFLAALQISCFYSLLWNCGHISSFIAKHWKTTVEEHKVPETICGNEAVWWMYVFKCLKVSERDVRTLKMIQPSTVRNKKQFQKFLQCWQEIVDWPPKWWKISCTLTGRCFKRFIMKVQARGISAPS
jgi:hypothetical protein